MGLILASDIVLVSPEASFTPYYSEVGFSPDGGWTAILPSIIGSKRVAEIIMLNRSISAEQSVAWGITNRIVPTEEVHQEALRIAQEISAKKPGSVTITKRLLQIGRARLAEGLKAEHDRFVRQIVTDEARQGIREFLGVI
jgi:enoyl-CoA hydratase/carnithine racemase